jgi:hypothetical protein
MIDLRAIILRYTWVLGLAALGSAATGIRDSSASYTGFRPWLLAAGPPRQRTSERPGEPRAPLHLGGHDTSAYPAAWSPKPKPTSRAKARFFPGAPFAGLGFAFFVTLVVDAFKWLFPC